MVWVEKSDGNDKSNGKTNAGLFASLRMTEQKRKQIPFGDDKTRTANATAATTVTATAAATTELRVE